LKSDFLNIESIERNPSFPLISIHCNYSVRHKFLVEKSKNQPLRNESKRQKWFRQKAEESAGSIKGSEHLNTSFCPLPHPLLPFEPIMEKLILSYFL